MAFSENSVIKISELRDAIYPIGSVYLSVNNVSPQTFFGGTWVALEKGRTLWTADPSKDDNGNTISEGTNNLSDNESTWKIEAGLPNIKGRLIGNANGTTNGAITGDFNLGNASTQKYPYYQMVQCTFDASKGQVDTTTGDYVTDSSKIVYGKADTVQPPSLRIYAWRRTA